MDLFVTMSIISIVSLLAVIVITILFVTSHNRMLKQVAELERQNTVYKRHINYLNRQIEGLKEHNSKLYDNNRMLQLALTPENTPDITQKW